MDITQMTTEELKQLRSDYYRKACDDGTISKLATIARELGKDPAGEGFTSAYGPKYKWQSTAFGYPLEIYVDDYDRFMTVTVNNKRVCSTHPCDRLFVPGAWVNYILSSYEDAQRQIEKRNQQSRDAEREKLVAELAPFMDGTFGLTE